MMKPLSTKQSKACRAFLCFIDSFLSIVIFSPIVVGYWRGCWQLMDKILIPSNTLYSMLASLGIGLGFGIIFGLFQDVFAKLSLQREFKITFFVISRIYTILLCFGSVNHWRGIWIAWDYYTGTSWESGAASVGIGLFVLALIRGVKNILAPPFVVVPDLRENYFVITTLFKTKRSLCGFFVLDMVFTVVVMGSLVVFVWRGSWIFLDRQLFPNNPTFSAWGSMVIGITVTILAFFSQLIMIPCLRRIQKGFWKIVLEDLYHTFCFVGAVNVWRGVWNLLNIYLYPDNPILSNSITAVGGNLILIIVFCANGTIPVKGADVDGSKDGALGVIFKTSYFRSFFETKLEKPTLIYDYWKAKEHLSSDPAGFIDISKSNGMMEGRGMGDGNSYSDGYNNEALTTDGQTSQVCVHTNDDISLNTLETKDTPQS